MLKTTISLFAFISVSSLALAAPPAPPTDLCAVDPKFAAMKSGELSVKFRITGDYKEFQTRYNGGETDQVSCIKSRDGVFPAKLYCFMGVDGAIDGNPGNIVDHQCSGIGQHCEEGDYFIVDDTYYMESNPQPDGEYRYCIGAHNEHTKNVRWWQLAADPK